MTMELISSAYKAINPRLRSADPELPTLATRAAVELDSRRRGISVEMSAVAELATLLRNSVTHPDSSPAATRLACLMDPSTVVVIARALDRAGEKPGPKTEDVCALTNQISGELEKIVLSSATEPRIHELRDFCVELARGVSATKQPYRFSSTTHPFRR